MFTSPSVCPRTVGLGSELYPVGLDLQKGTIRDLQAAGVMENVETVQQVLQFVKQSVKAVLDVASAI